MLRSPLLVKPGRATKAAAVCASSVSAPASCTCTCDTPEKPEISPLSTPSSRLSELSEIVSVWPLTLNFAEVSSVSASAAATVSLPDRFQAVAIASPSALDGLRILAAVSWMVTVCPPRLKWMLLDRLTRDSAFAAVVVWLLERVVPASASSAAVLAGSIRWATVSAATSVKSAWTAALDVQPAEPVMV